MITGLCYMNCVLTEALRELALMRLSLYQLLVRTEVLQDMLCICDVSSARSVVCMCVLCLLVSSTHRFCYRWTPTTLP